MKKTPISWRLPTIIFATLVFLHVGSATAFQDYAQPPIILDAKDVVSPDRLRGANYRVEDKVKNDGLINVYQLTTDYGPLEVESTAELMIRITELNALKTMEELDRKKVFGDALVEGAKAPVKGAVDLVKAPIETSKGIVKGTGRFLSNLGRSIVSSDPDQDNVLEVALGYDAAKRSFAYEFGIDPYSSYTPAMDRLGEIARAAVAGGLTPRVAMAAIDSPITTAMSISATAKGMKKLVRDNPPGELWKINKRKLEKMGISPSLAEDFLDNHSYNPQEETLLVGELETMKDVKGRDVFISVANAAAEESVARFYRQTAEMMAAYHANVARVERIHQINRILSLQKKDGVLVFLAPIDFVFWTKEVESKLNDLDSGIQKIRGVSGKQMWFTGKIDPTALAAFEANGWKVTETVDKILRK